MSKHPTAYELSHPGHLNMQRWMAETAVQRGDPSLPLRTMDDGMTVLGVEFSWADLFILRKVMEEFRDEQMKDCPPEYRRESHIHDLTERVRMAFEVINAAT